jgi:hypothetical protein
LRWSNAGVTIRRVLTPFRRTAAIVAAFGALAPLLAIRFAGSEASGGGGGQAGRLEFEYSYGELSASDGIAATLLALALAVAAAALWAARDRRLLGAAIAALAGNAIATALVAANAAAGGTPSRSELRAVPLGIDREGLEDRLGAPDGSGAARTLSSPYVELDCLVYKRPRSAGYLFCFRGDRLVRKVGR